jgi:hypothetical protein
MSYTPGTIVQNSSMKIVTSAAPSGQTVSTSDVTIDGSETSYTPAATDDTVCYQFTFYARSYNYLTTMLGRAQFTLQESTDDITYSDVSGASSNQIFMGIGPSPQPLAKRLITLRFMMAAYSGLKYFRIRGHAYDSLTYALILHTPDYWNSTPDMIYNPTSTIYGFKEAV